MPLPSLMQLIDTWVPILLHDFLASVLPSVPECFVGARPRTQCPDIAHALQSVMEKGLDDHSNAAVAQRDIEKYYDSLPVLLLVQWLVDRGLSINLALCLLRHQLCPLVTISVGSSQVAISGRTIGGLTGSRVAGLLGRIPVEDIMFQRCGVWRKWGYWLNPKDYDDPAAPNAVSVSLCCCSYVDNLFAVSRSLSGAIAILEDFEVQLLEWGLVIKPISRQCMVSAGSSDEAADSKRWPMVRTFPVLGHLLADTGSIRPCWKQTRFSMWKAFWANAGSSEVRRLHTAIKIMLLGRSVRPVLMYRCSRWPPQRTIGGEVDSVQCKMVSSILRVQRRSFEEPAEYCRRRNRDASALCRQLGLWSSEWFKRALAWHEHLQRPRNRSPWSALLGHHRGMIWLQAQRAALLGPRGSEGSVLAGRTGTRSIFGAPCVRWHDGVVFAGNLLG